mgnify:CR=1 FL=1
MYPNRRPRHVELQDIEINSPPQTPRHLTNPQDSSPHHISTQTEFPRSLCDRICPILIVLCFSVGCVYISYSISLIVYYWAKMKL